jgi:hypothetical protein
MISMASAFSAIVIVLLVGIYVTMSILIAPYADAVKAAGEDQAQLTQIFATAMANQQGVATAALVIGAVIMFLITSRFYLAAPASVDQRRIVVFESWRWTRGATLRIAAARFILLAPAFVLVGALQSLAAAALGFNADPASLLAQAQSAPAMFAAFYGAALFLQVIIYTALEAGLSAYLYRALRAADAPAPPA